MYQAVQSSQALGIQDADVSLSLETEAGSSPQVVGPLMQSPLPSEEPSPYMISPDWRWRKADGCSVFLAGETPPMRSVIGSIRSLSLISVWLCTLRLGESLSMCFGFFTHEVEISNPDSLPLREQSVWYSQGKYFAWYPAHGKFLETFALL